MTGSERRLALTVAKQAHETNAAAFKGSIDAALAQQAGIVTAVTAYELALDGKGSVSKVQAKLAVDSAMASAVTLRNSFEAQAAAQSVSLAAYVAAHDSLARTA
ncbi:MAG: hypothetical protein NVS1B6_16830 [Steroidobacteraceae bacterium]